VTKIIQNLVRILVAIVVILVCYILYFNFSPGAFFSNCPFFSNMIIVSSLFLFILLYFFFLKQRITFLEIFIHEFTHMTITLMGFRKIYSFSVSKTEGLVYKSGKMGFLELLAPYCIPILPLFFMLIFYIADIRYQQYIVFFIAISYLMYLLRSISQFSFNQDDIQRGGKLFSLVFVLGINLIFLLFFIHFFCGEIQSFFKLFNIDNIQKALTL